jgi:hypothetical protein
MAIALKIRNPCVTLKDTAANESCREISPKPQVKPSTPNLSRSTRLKFRRKVVCVGVRLRHGGPFGLLRVCLVAQENCRACHLDQFIWVLTRLFAKVLPGAGERRIYI